MINRLFGKVPGIVEIFAAQKEYSGGIAESPVVLEQVPLSSRYLVPEIRRNNLISFNFKTMRHRKFVQRREGSDHRTLFFNYPLEIVEFISREIICGMFEDRLLHRIGKNQNDDISNSRSRYAI